MVAQNVKDDLLDRPVLEGSVVTFERLAWLILVVVAGLSRFVNLGVRAMSHDESMHAYFSFLLYDTGSYRHDPALHGPLLFHLNALVYLLLGDSDFTARLVPALSGCVLILSLFAFRGHLGRWGALAAAGFAVVSPSILCISRYLVIDIPMLLCSLAWVYGAFRYLEERRPFWLYLVVASMALSTASKANAFIFGATVGSFLLALALLRGARRAFPVAARGARDLSVLMFTLVLPFLSPPLHLALGWGQAVFTLTEGVGRSLSLVLLNSIAAVAIAWLFFGRKVRKRDSSEPLDFALWARLMFLFWVVQVLFFTTFFTNTVGGFASGIVGSLSYWIEQHGVRRGGAPWFYYLVTASVYELLVLLTAVCAAVSILRMVVSWKRIAVAEGVYPSPGSEAIDARPAAGLHSIRFLFGCFALWWAFGSWLAYSFAGERMPWLLVHMTFPTILVSGWWLGWTAESEPWKKAGWAGTVWLIPAVSVLALLSSTLLATRPFTGRTLEAAGLTVRWITACALFLVLAVFILRTVRRRGLAASSRALLLGIGLPLALMTVRSSGMLNYRNYDLATELLVYAHATPDIKATLSEIDAVIQRTGDQDQVLVSYDDESTWPFAWYFRHYPGIAFYGMVPDASIAASRVVIVGPKNRAKVEPLLGANYVKRTRRLIWWPTEDYYHLTPQAAWNVLADRGKRQALWQFLVYRRYPGVSLLEWPRRHEFDVYLRADVAARIWGLPAESPAGMKTEIAECIPELLPESVEVFDGRYEGARLKSPCGLAVSEEGAVAIADTGNDRIVVLGRTGRPVRVFGRRCQLEEGSAGGCTDEDGSGPQQLGDGQFLEPWGVAISRDGRVFVADTWNSRIQAFDPEGRLLWKWGALGSVTGTDGDPHLLYGPRGLAVTLGDTLLATDTGNRRVLRFRLNGELLGQSGGSGPIPGRFDEPVGIAVDPKSGEILVADAWNRRIQRFDAGMRFLQELAVPGWRSRNAASKPYLAVDSRGNVFAADPAESRLLVFDARGQVEHFIRTLGIKYGDLSRPTGVAVDPTDDSIWVADSGNDRVVRLRLAAVAADRSIGRQSPAFRESPE